MLRSMCCRQGMASLQAAAAWLLRQLQECSPAQLATLGPMLSLVQQVPSLSMQRLFLAQAARVCAAMGSSAGATLGLPASRNLLQLSTSTEACPGLTAGGQTTTSLAWHRRLPSAGRAAQIPQQPV